MEAQTRTHFGSQLPSKIQLLLLILICKLNKRILSKTQPAQRCKNRLRILYKNPRNRSIYSSLQETSSVNHFPMWICLAKLFECDSISSFWFWKSVRECMIQGATVGMLCSPNERNRSYVRLAHTTPLYLVCILCQSAYWNQTVTL